MLLLAAVMIVAAGTAGVFALTVVAVVFGSSALCFALAALEADPY